MFCLYLISLNEKSLVHTALWLHSVLRLDANIKIFIAELFKFKKFCIRQAIFIIEIMSIYILKARKEIEGFFSLIFQSFSSFNCFFRESTRPD